MCKICRGGDLTGIKELDCSYCDSITEIPNIEGLQKLICFGCYWLNPSKEKLLKVLTLQKYFKRYLLSKHLMNIIDEVSKVYYMPGCKGFYLCEKEFNCE